jgi:hypothetical protein
MLNKYMTIIKCVPLKNTWVTMVLSLLMLLLKLLTFLLKSQHTKQIFNKSFLTYRVEALEGKTATAKQGCCI